MALRQLALLSALCVGGASADEEGRAKLLLHKKLTPPGGPFVVGKPINITLQVWNQGELMALAPGSVRRAAAAASP